MAASTWNIDLAHSAIHFSVRHMVVSKTRGRFAKWSGKITFDPEKPSAGSVEVAIEPASIDTGEPQRDGHLRSADFFDVEKYPTATFKSTKVQDQGGKLRITGDLTVHGVTKPVVLEATYEGAGKDPWGGERVGFSATTSIDRREFGLQWNKALETGGVLVGEKVELSLEVEAVKRSRSQRDVQDRLRAVEDACRSDKNLMHPVLDAVKAYATLGEVCDVFRKVWGAFREKGSF